MELLDWGVLVAYGLVVVAIGVRTGRGHQSTEDLFLGGRRIPAWAALCSMVATELSAATFIGVPQMGYNGDWWYLQYAIGSLLARVVLATWFISLYYRLRLVTVYGLMGQRFGRSSELTSAWFFLVGRLIASGSRLFIASLAFATVTELSMEASILLAGGLAMVYTLAGGIRAVIWTDTLQGAVFIVAAGGALVVLGNRLTGGLEPAWDLAQSMDRTTIIRLPDLLVQGTSAGETWGWLRETWEGFRLNYLRDGTSLVTAIVGGFFLTLATHGTDQDMVQRLLTTKSSRKGGGALISSGFANFPLVTLFLLVGTGMWAFYQSELGAFSGEYSIANLDKIFPTFVLHEVPTGLRGLIFAGLFAAAMSSMDSALNSLATTWVVNVRSGKDDAQTQLSVTRRATLVFGLLLMGAALLLVLYKNAFEADGSRLNLIELALSSMSILYGGLLGAFLVALVTPGRGTDVSVTTGMLAGGVIGAFLFLHKLVLGELHIAFAWWIVISASVAFLIGISRPRERAER